jgi:hypothetical protein
VRESVIDTCLAWGQGWMVSVNETRKITGYILPSFIMSLDNVLLCVLWCTVSINKQRQVYDIVGSGYIIKIVVLMQRSKLRVSGVGEVGNKYQIGQRFPRILLDEGQIIVHGPKQWATFTFIPIDRTSVKKLWQGSKRITRETQNEY